MFNKILKVSLIKEQVDAKIEHKIFDGYEIHLLGKEKDDFSLLEKLSCKPIKTFHFPIEKCRIGTFEIGDDKKYIEQLLHECQKYHSGVILHHGGGFDFNEQKETELNLAIKNKDLQILIEQMKEKTIPLYIENASIASCKDVVDMTNKLSHIFNYRLIYPLLDICHYQISANQINSKETNLAKTLDLFNSNDVKLHFCDSVGCGRNIFGGIHGSNFKYNQPLMKEILDHLKGFRKNIDLILEVDEENYNEPKNAVWLAERINEYLDEDKF